MNDFVTDKNNGLHIDDLTPVEQKFVRDCRRINRLGQDFCHSDFGDEGKIWFRQMIFKLRKKGWIVTTIKTNPCFYRIKGEYTGWERKDITHEGMGVGTNMQSIINEASKQIPALHDIKIQFPSTELHQNALKQGKKPNPHNKGIFEKDFQVSQNVTVNFGIYPESVTLDLACTYYPIIYDFKGSLDLIEILTRVQDYLIINYDTFDIPSPLNWIATHYHLNQDGQREFCDPHFHRTISDIAGGFIRDYAKRFPDGSLRLRSERAFTPNISIKTQLDDMKRVGNYLSSEKEDLSNLLPSQILGLNRLASINERKSGFFNPLIGGICFI